MTIAHAPSSAVTDKPSATLTLGFAERIILFAIALGTVVVSIGGNYILGNWRLAQLEAREEKIELKQEALEGALTQAILKTDINEARMDGKLDMLVDHLQRLEHWADKGFDERRIAGSVDR